MPFSFLPSLKPIALPIWLPVALLLLAPVATPADDARIDPRDPDIFTPDYFPDLSEISENHILLTGLKTLYPKRIVSERPAMGDTVAARETRREMIGGHIVYLRVYDLGKALPVIEENIHRNLLIDLRNVYADLPSTLSLGALLALGDEFALYTHGTYPYQEQGISDLDIAPAEKRQSRNPVIVLTNTRTRGPLEALLDALQQRGEIITVGRPTAGATGAYRKLLDDPPLYIINGDIRGSAERLLLEEGFTPAIRSKVTSREDEKAYLALESDAPIEALLRRDNDRPRFDEARLVREFEQRRDEPQDNDEEELEPPHEDYPHDGILWQAVNIIKALEALGELAPFSPGA